MGRIPLIDPEDPSADPRARELLRSFGGRLNVFRGMANHAPILEAVLMLGTAAYWGGSLSPRHRELAYLGASAVNTCHY